MAAVLQRALQDDRSRCVGERKLSCPGFDATRPGQRQRIVAFQLARTLRSSGVPCLVVCGDSDDAWSPAAQRDMAERLDADFAVLPGVMHSPNTEAPLDLLATLLPTWRAWLSS